MEKFEHRRVEVLVDEPLVSKIIDLAVEAGITGYTVLRVLGGGNAQNRWREDRITRADSKVMFISITTPETSEKLLAKLEPLLTSQRLLVTTSLTHVIRPAKF